MSVSTEVESKGTSPSCGSIQTCEHERLDSLVTDTNLSLEDARMMILFHSFILLELVSVHGFGSSSLLRNDKAPRCTRPT